MWNEKTKSLVADDKLVVLGVVQEQHAERARLYKQWKRYDFPIVQDSVTGLGLGVVPIPILIDEYGYVMKSRPKTNEIEELVGQTVSAPAKPAPKLDAKHVTAQWLKSSQDEKSSTLHCALGDALLFEGTIDSTKEAIEQYRAGVAKAEAEKNETLKGLALFRLGVAYRSLFDLSDADKQDSDDFTRAALAWTEALDTNPNQYIWRRRIQQYGPRQIKPYPFYDWVEEATREIAERGEQPLKLRVPLSGAEIAQPNRKFESTAASAGNPDAEGKIIRDEEQMVRFHATVVPQKVAPGKTVRVHLRFAPDQGHWNNEADDMLLWINDSEFGVASESRLTHPNVKEPSSDEPRTMEFEFKINADVEGAIELTGYALYYVCTTDDGQCLYRRQDITIPIRVEK